MCFPETNKNICLRLLDHSDRLQWISVRELKFKVPLGGEQFECCALACGAVKVGRQTLSASVCAYNHNLPRTWRQEVLSRPLLIYPTARSHISDNCTPSSQEFIVNNVLLF